MKTLRSFIQSKPYTGPLCMTAFFAALVLTGCSSDVSAPLAPRPPMYAKLKAGDYERMEITKVAFNSTPEDLGRIETAAGAPHPDVMREIRAKYQAPASCKLKDRLDRGVLVAYNWGQGGQNRLSFDVDGVDPAGGDMDVEEVKLQYSLRLQPHMNKKQKCKAETQWQGLVGTGYHELYTRDGEAVRQEIKKIRQEVSQRLDVMFD